MDKVEFLNAISWHLECMALSADAIDLFRPPADAFQMRMHHSLYLTNLMSAVEIVYEVHHEEFRTDLKQNLGTSRVSGADVLGYVRELRNGIVHRGMDPIASGTVVDGMVCAIAPAVQDRFRKHSYYAPAYLLRDVLIHCDIGIKPVIERYCEPSIEELLSLTAESMRDDAVEEIGAADHVPGWVKEQARHLIVPEMLIEMRTHQIEKLRKLLRPQRGRRIA